MKRAFAPEIKVTHSALYQKALEICQLSLGLRTENKTSDALCGISGSDLISDHHLDMVIFSSVDLPRTIAQAALQQDRIIQKSLSNYIRLTTKKVKRHLKMLGRERFTNEAQFLALSQALKEFGQLQKRAIGSQFQNN